MYEANQCPYTGEPCGMPDCTGCEIEKEAQEYMEDIMATELQAYFDRNGDPYRDFMGNPW